MVWDGLDSSKPTKPHVNRITRTGWTCSASSLYFVLPTDRCHGEIAPHLCGVPHVHRAALGWRRRASWRCAACSTSWPTARLCEDQRKGGHPFFYHLTLLVVKLDEMLYKKQILDIVLYKKKNCSVSNKKPYFKIVSNKKFSYNSCTP
jgi:hypothetical protein